ncbi:MULTISPECIES: hypothetical protein [unclassified Minwuia]|jgi:hypothetical protein|uniref:hypothetical protein n=1 Tax=unclassified Minwuia TaxID=2618799 RepID=UPI00247A8294|nr:MULTISPECIES: hypothetical protein [unclassified Minwuia]
MATGDGEDKDRRAGKAAAEAEKQARLAARLRENLKRRRAPRKTGERPAGAIKNTEKH